jgi:solute carrier family 6 amino acid/orphan transporter-like 15/16/17/18/20
MFFTLSLGFGALSSFASFMPYKNQCMRDAYTVVFVNCGTSLFAGIVVFSILGYREIQTGIDAAQVHYFLTLYTPSSKPFYRHQVQFINSSMRQLWTRKSSFSHVRIKKPLHPCIEYKRLF